MSNEIPHRGRRQDGMFDMDEVGSVRLEMRRSRQPGEVVAEQPPTGVRLSDESEKSTRKQLRSVAASKAAVPSTEVCNESIQVESRKRAADKASKT